MRVLAAVMFPLLAQCGNHVVTVEVEQPSVVVWNEGDAPVNVDPPSRLDIIMVVDDTVGVRCDDMGGVLTDGVCVGVDY